MKRVKNTVTRLCYETKVTVLMIVENDKNYVTQEKQFIFNGAHTRRDIEKEFFRSGINCTIKDFEIVKNRYTMDLNNFKKNSEKEIIA